MNLDLDVAEQEVLLQRLEQTMERITKELEIAKRQVGREHFAEGAQFALESACTIGLSMVAADMGGPLAAGGITALGIAVATGRRIMSTIGSAPDGAAKSIAMSIVKIEKRSVPKSRKVPNYWL